MYLDRSSPSEKSLHGPSRAKIRSKKPDIPFETLEDIVRINEHTSKPCLIPQGSSVKIVREPTVLPSVLHVSSRFRIMPVVGPAARSRDAANQ